MCAIGAASWPFGRKHHSFGFAAKSSFPLAGRLLLILTGSGFNRQQEIVYLLNLQHLHLFPGLVRLNFNRLFFREFF